MKKFYTNR